MHAPRSPLASHNARGCLPFTAPVGSLAPSLRGRRRDISVNVTGERREGRRRRVACLSLSAMPACLPTCRPSFLPLWVARPCDRPSRTPLPHTQYERRRRCFWGLGGREGGRDHATRHDGWWPSVLNSPPCEGWGGWRQWTARAPRPSHAIWFCSTALTASQGRKSEAAGRE